MVDLVIQHHGSTVLSSTDQIFPDDNNGDPRWPHVLLSSSINDPKFRYVHRFRAEIGGHISHQQGFRIRIILEFNPMDGFVRTNMQIFGIRALFQILECWDFGVFFSFAGPNYLRFTVFLSLFEGLVAPRAGDDIIYGVIRFAQIQRDRGELSGGAALQEQNGVIGGNIQKASEI